MTRPCHCDRTGLGSYRLEWCRRCWLAKNTVEGAQAWGLPQPVAPFPLGKRTIDRPDRCEFLGADTHTRICKMLSLHKCRKGLAAIPATNCQGCGSYVAESDEPWVR